MVDNWRFEEELRKIPEIKSKIITDLNELEARAGTNGAGGGDWGHGYRHYIALINNASTGWMVRVTLNDGRRLVFDSPEAVEILMGGTSEFRTLIKALRFILTTLRKMNRDTI